MYRELTESMIKAYGRECEIKIGSSSQKINCRAFVNPLFYKNKSMSENPVFFDGFYSGGYWQYIGQADVELDNMPFGTTVVCDNEEFLIKRAERFFIDNTAVYTMAVLKKKTRSDDNASPQFSHHRP